MSHIFISYSTKNSDYANKLANKLRDKGFNVWIDNAELRSSDNWWESIVRALRASDAFIIIMTPESRDSKWVQREVILADNWSKPAFPLLLDDDNFEIYVLTQFKDVRNGQLPPDEFYVDLARYTERRQQRGENLTDEAQSITVDDSAVQEALANPPEQDDNNLSHIPTVEADTSSGFSSAKPSSGGIQSILLIALLLFGANALFGGKSGDDNPQVTGAPEETQKIIVSDTPTLESTPTNNNNDTDLVTPDDGVCRAIVEAPALNVRSQPTSTHDNVIIAVSSGTLMPIVARLSDNSWWKVEAGSYTGWVSSLYTALSSNCDSVPIENVVLATSTP